MMKSRDAHSELACDVIDPQRLIEILSKMSDRSRDPARIAAF